MTFEQWLMNAGWDPTTLTESQKTILQASFDADQDNGTKEGVDSLQTKKVEASSSSAAATDDPNNATRIEAAAETRRIGAIRKLCAGKHTDIEANAIEGGWSTEKVEIEIMKANAPRLPAIINAGGQGGPVAPLVLEAAIRLGSEEDKKLVERDYKPEVLERAEKHRRMSIKALIQAACMLEGVSCPMIGDNVNDWVKAGFSTTSLPGILSNVANKSMLAAYQRVPSGARAIAKRLTTKDFKTNTGYRLTGDPTMKKVGQDGQLKAITLGETSFTYAVDTYGSIIALTRQQWYNDDLGAFTEIPLMIGRGAALAIEDLFWALVLGNGNNFFHANNKNLITGADTALGISGLDIATQTMAEQVDDKNKPILVTPKNLVVPPALLGEGNRIFKGEYLAATGVGNAAKLAANTNTYTGLYQPVMSPYLKGKPKEWYLFGDQNDIAAFGLAFLNGVDNPVVEEAPMAPDVLGFSWRGYIDFGACQIDPRGAVKSKGEA